jgi:hypothetical protein
MKTWDDRQLKFDIEEFNEVADDAAERFIPPEEAAKISEAARNAFDYLRQNSLIKKDDDRGCGWFDDYLRLIEWGWPWRVATYIAWASSPKIGRWPGTLQELATDVLGLTSPRVIYTWRQKYPTIDQVIAIMQAKPLLETRRDRFEVLAKLSVKEDYKYFDHLKLAMEMDGSYVPKSQLELGDLAEKDEKDLSEAELRKNAGEKWKKLSAEYYPEIDHQENISSPDDRKETVIPPIEKKDEGIDDAGV